jgi:hypothetical protein
MLDKASEEFLRDEMREFENCWNRYREMNWDGIHKESIDEVGNLYSQFCVLKAQAELKLGVAEANKNSAEVKLHNIRAKLLRTVYSDGSMAQRNAEVESDEKYLEQKEVLGEQENILTLTKAEVKAYETAASGLSREMSKRLK